MNILIVDDEPLARRTLHEHLLAAGCTGAIFEASDGIAAIQMTDELRPELMFLDVRMPGASGLDVIRRIAHRPYVIFTTAFDRYAVTAFEIGALDYLLKPFGRDRVMKALRRAHAAVGDDGASTAGRAGEALTEGKPLTHVFVKERQRIVRVPLDGVLRLEACDDYVALYTATRRHLLSARLYDLLDRLDPQAFIRIHRSHAVNTRFIRAIEPRTGSRVDVVLSDGTRLSASRAGATQLNRLTRT